MSDIVLQLKKKRKEKKERIVEAQPDILLDTSQNGQGDLRTEEMLVNMGPQHPATHGVLRVVLRTDGELVLEAVPHIGYLHRCAEKIGENLQAYQFVPKTDRMDYLAGMNNNQAFALAIDNLRLVDGYGFDLDSRPALVGDLEPFLRFEINIGE